MMNERTLSKAFEITIVGKGITACIDIGTAAVLYLYGTSKITAFFVTIAQAELVEDPDSSIAQFVLMKIPTLYPEASTFVILYLLIHALIKITFLTGLWRDRAWAYPFALVSLTAFVAYQLYRIAHIFSLWLTVFTIIDIAVIVLIWHEYRYRSKKHVLH
jgi:uncharacterized membrane protein